MDAHRELQVCNRESERLNKPSIWSVPRRADTPLMLSTDET